LTGFFRSVADFIFRTKKARATLLPQKASKSIENENRKQKQNHPNRRSFFRSFPDATHRVLPALQLGKHTTGNEPRRPVNSFNPKPGCNFIPDLLHERILPVDQTVASNFHRTKYPAFLRFVLSTSHCGRIYHFRVCDIRVSNHPTILSYPGHLLRAGSFAETY
jgi:hypothetical protein